MASRAEQVSEITGLKTLTKTGKLLSRDVTESPAPPFQTPRGQRDTQLCCVVIIICMVIL